MDTINTSTLYFNTDHMLNRFTTTKHLIAIERVFPQIHRLIFPEGTLTVLNKFMSVQKALADLCSGINKFRNDPTVIQMTRDAIANKLGDIDEMYLQDALRKYRKLQEVYEVLNGKDLSTPGDFLVGNNLVLNCINEDAGYIKNIFDVIKFASNCRNKKNSIAISKKHTPAKHFSIKEAKRIWEKQPGAAISDVATHVHRELENDKYLDGRKYALSTIKNWIKEYAPQTHKRRGRPKGKTI